MGQGCCPACLVALDHAPPLGSAGSSLVMMRDVLGDSLQQLPDK